MKYKVEIILITLLAIIASLIYTPVPIAEAQVDGWVIDGDSVYINDSNVYLSATPHTLSGSGWVEFEILSKNYEGELDIAWGFDDKDNIEVEKPQKWEKNVPHLKYKNVPIELVGNITFDNIESLQVVVKDKDKKADIGNENNTNLVKIKFKKSDDELQDNTTIAYEYKVEVNGSTTFFYKYDGNKQEPYVEYYDDWKGVTSSSVTKEKLNYKDCDDWQFTTLDAPIVKNTLYKVRCWIEVPFRGETPVEGKYNFAIKPHSETLQQAISLGHLYMLDPWYNGSWAYRETITIDHAYVNGTQLNFPVYIDEHELSATFWANVQADGEDRFAPEVRRAPC